MNNDFRQQEILLITGTSFSCRKWLTDCDGTRQIPMNKKEQLKQACWEGMVPQMLPECFDFCYDKSVRLWEMNEASAFINLEYSNLVKGIERKRSVNPYVFLNVLDYN